MKYNINRTLILTSVMKTCRKYKRGMARLAWVPRVVVAEGWLVNVIITRRRGEVLALLSFYVGGNVQLQIFHFILIFLFFAWPK